MKMSEKCHNKKHNNNNYDNPFTDGGKNRAALYKTELIPI